MTETKTDPREAASDYRDYLISELARIDDFIELADRVAEDGDDVGFGLVLLTAGAASAAVH
jgi:hypothetical protein